jgi:hypothetical protein
MNADPTGPREGFLSYCVPRTIGNPMLRQIHAHGAGVVTAVFRLVKNVMIHAPTNEAVTKAVEQLGAALKEFSAMTGGPTSITFTKDTVFVCGQLLRASRSIYDAARELGRIMEACGVSEAVFDHDVSIEALLRFAVLLVASSRDPSRRDALARTEIPGVIVRRTDVCLEKGEGEGSTPSEQIMNVYATAYMVMQKFFEAVAMGLMIMPPRIKRIAQRLVLLAEQHEAGVLGLTTLANVHRNDAGRAVQSAILTIVVGRRITRDRVALARIAMAALMADIGRARAVGPEGRDRLVRLSDEVEAAIPGHTGAMGIVTGGVNPHSALRTAIMFETTWLERAGQLGAVYDHRFLPLLQSRILDMVRALIDRIAPRDPSPATSPFAALQALAGAPDTDPVLLRLLVSAIGAIPVGSVVELSNGAWAVVVKPSDSPGALDRPVVRVLTDGEGTALQELSDIDLGAPEEVKGGLRIARVIEPARIRFNVTRTLLF